jgi:pseudaminic acid cytidylyltransferase
MNENCIAVIPARGGSKRVPKKNIKNFFGKPMISYAIEAAINSQLFDHIVVSTDDLEIRDIALKYGAKAPFLRPPDLADDYAPTVPVVAHAIRECELIGWEFNFVCCIYPCVPFIQVEDLKGALRRCLDVKTRYCFPIARSSHSIFHALKMDNSHVMDAFFHDNENKRTQDFDATFYDAGQFYWASKNTWLTNFNVHTGGLGFEIPNWRAIDIDTADDWRMAELAYQFLGLGKK